MGRQPTKKPPKAKYKFSPKVHVIAASKTEVFKLHQSREIIKDVLKGQDYEAIAEKRGMDPIEVRNLAKRQIERWGNEMGVSAVEAKMMDLKRMDAMLEQLHTLIYPEPYIDTGTNQMVTPKPDMQAMKIALDILAQRAKLLGTEAAHKLETEKMEFLRREYAGVKLNAQGEIDL